MKRSLVLAFMLVMLCSVAVYADTPSIHKAQSKFVLADCTTIGISIMLPEDWQFMVADSSDDYYLFFGPGDYEYLELKSFQLEPIDVTSVNFIAFGQYDYLGQLGYSSLMVPAPIQFGNEFGMIYGYVASDETNKYVAIEVMCLFENQLVVLTICDEMNNFLNNVAIYDQIVTSFTNNPTRMGNLEKFIAGWFPYTEQIPQQLMQGYVEPK